MAEPISVQQLKDASLDATSLSEFVWKPAEFMVTRRLAPSIHTLNYYVDLLDSVAINGEAQIIQAIINSGFAVVDSFELGATITARNQALRHTATGKLYRWSGDLPKTVAPSTLPSSDTKWLEVSDTVLRQELASGSGYRKVSNQMAANAYGAPAPLVDAEYKVAIPEVQEYFDGYFWGTVGATIKRSIDSYTWTDYCTAPAAFQRIIKVSDGEVVAMNSESVFKSTGWATGTVTWAKKVQNTSSGSLAPFLRWGFDGYGDKLILTHYSSGGGRELSRYVWISTDAGNTWTVKWDSETLGHTGSHLHAVCYDKWQDRFWVSEAHGTASGLYWSDDNGNTWTKLINDGGATASAPFTVMVATDFGVVCGTDDVPNGVYLMRRDKNPEVVGIEYYAAWEDGGNSEREALIGFADRGYRDADTGIVYIGFKSDYADVASVIFACGSGGAQIVHTAPLGSATSTRFVNVVAAKGLLLAQFDGYAAYQGVMRARTSKFTSAPKPIDLGNFLTKSGYKTRRTAMRAGINSVAGGQYGIAIGHSANSGNDRGTIALGRNAVTGTAGAVSIGMDSTTVGFESGIAIGLRATSSALHGTAIGKDSKALAARSIAVGESANAGAGSGGIAVGYNSKTLAGNSMAIGYGASAQFLESIAVGTSATASAGYSVVIGSTASGASRAVVVGTAAYSLAGDGVVVGGSASITANTSGIAQVAIGRSAKSNANGGVAIGANAEVNHAYAVSLGFGTVSTRASTVTVGNRDIESTKDGGAIYLKSPNGTTHKITVGDDGVLTAVAV